MITREEVYRRIAKRREECPELASKLDEVTEMLESLPEGFFEVATEMLDTMLAKRGLRLH